MDITLDFLEQQCGIVIPRLGDATLREKLKQLETDIADIYPPSGEALRLWQTTDLNPRLLSLCGEYNEIQLKENIILPILNLAKLGTSPFAMAKCPEYPLCYEDDQIKLGIWCMANPLPR